MINENAYVVGIPSDWGMSSTFNVCDLVRYLPMSDPIRDLEPHTLPGQMSDVIERPSPSPPVSSPPRHERVESVLREVIHAAEGRVGRKFLVRWQDRPATEDAWISEEDMRRLRPELIEPLDEILGSNSSESSSSHPGRMMEDHARDQATARAEPDGARGTTAPEHAKPMPRTPVSSTPHDAILPASFPSFLLYLFRETICVCVGGFSPCFGPSLVLLDRF